MPASTTSPAFSTVAAIGDVTGLGLKSARWMTRLLQDDGRGYWPTPGPGRRATRLGVDDVLNLVVALECSPRLAAQGPQVVSEFRALRKERIDYTKVTQDDHGQAVVHQAVKLPFEVPPLAEWMEAWVHGLVHPGEIEHPLDDARLQAPEVRIKLSSPLTASVTLRDAKGSGSNEVIHYTVDPGATAAADVHTSKLGRTEVVIGLDEMEALATILRAAHVPDLLSGSGSPSEEDGDAGDTPDKKKAASGANPSGLLEHPTPTAQATPRDLAGIEDSLPEQEASKQPLAGLSGPGSRVRHRSAVRRTAEPQAKKASNAHRYDATAP